MTVVGIAAVVFVVVLILNGWRNDRRFAERYPHSASILREMRQREEERESGTAGSE